MFGLGFGASRPTNGTANITTTEASSTHRLSLLTFSALGTAIFIAAFAAGATAQEAALQPGEAFATRFSGVIEVTDVDGERDIAIDMDGVVGSIIDVRAPGTAPGGQHWADEPQRAAVTAEEIGQVFGIAIDDVEPANIYLTASSAFGLHRTPDNSEWLPGMWGPFGTPGTIYRLGGDNDYNPEVFAQLTLDGRENTGAALGNIAYDRWNKQLFVSDLETGMIYRIDPGSAETLDFFDHGVDGRGSFVDGATGDAASLSIIPFATGTAADVENCDTDFSSTPECWNIADFRRRVWGLGVFPDADGEKVRLYYAIWGADPLGSREWARGGDDRQNALWSVALKGDGSFDIDEVRREFILPHFDEDGLQNGAAVTDIAFSRDGTVILAERGGVRNMGLDGDHPFATPQISRVLQYKRRGTTWRFLARFDVGYYDRQNDGTPYIRANAAGGVDFGFAYSAGGQLDASHPDAIVWATGDGLCSPDGPCNGANGRQDGSEVHGLQGTPRRYDTSLLPDGTLGEYPDQGTPYAPTGPDNSFLIDLDVNTDASGRLDARQASYDNTTMIGDVEVHRQLDILIQQPEAPAVAALPQIVVPEPPGGVPEPQQQYPGSAPQSIDPSGDPQLAEFHRRYESSWHDRSISAPVHDGNISHNRAGSQLRTRSNGNLSNQAFDDNDEDVSASLAGHVSPWSHYRPGSHRRRASYRHFRNSSQGYRHSRIQSALD
jgi:hypothetical protein